MFLRFNMPFNTEHAYIQLVKVLYCKLLTNGKHLSALPLEVRLGISTLTSEVVGKWVTTVSPWPALLEEAVIVSPLT